MLHCAYSPIYPSTLAFFSYKVYFSYCPVLTTSARCGCLLYISCKLQLQVACCNKGTCYKHKSTYYETQTSDSKTKQKTTPDTGEIRNWRHKRTQSQCCTNKYMGSKHRRSQSPVTVQNVGLCSTAETLRESHELFEHGFIVFGNKPALHAHARVREVLAHGVLRLFRPDTLLTLFQKPLNTRAASAG